MPGQVAMPCQTPLKACMAALERLRSREIGYSMH